MCCVHSGIGDVCNGGSGECNFCCLDEWLYDDGNGPTTVPTSAPSGPSMAPTISPAPTAARRRLANPFARALEEEETDFGNEGGSWDAADCAEYTMSEFPDFICAAEKATDYAVQYNGECGAGAPGARPTSALAALMAAAAAAAAAAAVWS